MNIRYYSFGMLALVMGFFVNMASAITITLPSSDGNRDIILVGPTQVSSQSDLVVGYIQLVNKYLWFAMVVLLFALIVWMGFRIMTNPAGEDQAKTALKDGLKGAAVGTLVVLFSYTIVRLVINLL